MEASLTVLFVSVLSFQEAMHHVDLRTEFVKTSHCVLTASALLILL